MLWFGLTFTLQVTSTGQTIELDAALVSPTRRQR